MLWCAVQLCAVCVCALDRSSVSEAVAGIAVRLAASPLHALTLLPPGSTLQDVTGGCERILRTPVPLAYTR